MRIEKNKSGMMKKTLNQKRKKSREIRIKRKIWRKLSRNWKKWLLRKRSNRGKLKRESINIRMYILVCTILQ